MCRRLVSWRVVFCAAGDRSGDKEKEPKKKKKRKAKKMGPLSFDMDIGEDEAGEDLDVKPKRMKKSIKNPNVETDFLPDKEREKVEASERQRLKEEWEAEQERIKSAYLSWEEMLDWSLRLGHAMMWFFMLEQMKVSLLPTVTGMALVTAGRSRYACEDQN
ncbi:unnamed protein product [Phytophthora fragariaefolia]|uniref:Unnamed protein product n=1 Tax=Phytophthora fragariaefolia TaxID=1490495 RepID=A0A9W6Y7B8_9STRA|nr:unnamed protein product [Phytophthora fragariaefolia]